MTYAPVHQYVCAIDGKQAEETRAPAGLMFTICVMMELSNSKQEVQNNNKTKCLWIIEAVRNDPGCRNKW